MQNTQNYFYLYFTLEHVFFFKKKKKNPHKKALTNKEGFDSRGGHSSLLQL
jgi:hypothetical protein